MQFRSRVEKELNVEIRNFLSKWPIFWPSRACFFLFVCFRTSVASRGQEGRTARQHLVRVPGRFALSDSSQKLGIDALFPLLTANPWKFAWIRAARRMRIVRCLSEYTSTSIGCGRLDHKQGLYQLFALACQFAHPSIEVVNLMITIRRFFFFIALFITPPSTYAETYYIDAINGNDGWSGKLNTVSGSTDGPWQSLKKISTVGFQPGDVILLKCGQTWFETLKLNSNGTPAGSITVGSFPAACNNKPAIEGSVRIPAGSWSNAGDSIYRTQLPIDLLTAAPLGAGAIGWGVWSQNGDATLSSSNDCGPDTTTCAAGTTGASGTYTIISSRNFALNASSSYTVRFTAKVPTGVRYHTKIRRNGPPWDIVGPSQPLIGTGDWKMYAFSFNPTTGLGNARLDLELPGGKIAFSVGKPSLELQNLQVLGAYINGAALSEAHHPNAGRDSEQPDSVYLKLARDSSVNAATGSTYLAIGDDVGFPSGGAISPLQTVHLRSAPWQLDERKIIYFDGKTITLDKPSSYPPRAGYGYYLTGSLWMLDEPGEWHHDSRTGVLHIWMPDGQAPANRVSLATLAAGVDLSNRSNVIIDNLAIRRAGTGILLRNSSGVKILNSLLSDTASEGIDIKSARSGVIDNNRIERTGRDAISGSTTHTSGMTITNNNIFQSGVRISSNGQKSLPVPAISAITAGTHAVVSGNSVMQSAYSGIYVSRGSHVANNSIQESCMLLDDCGGIYTGGVDNNSTISGNVILNLAGSVDGTARETPHTAGIYLDELSSGITVSGNTIAFAAYGIQLHNAARNHVDANTLYGNHNYQLWLQEETRRVDPAGDMSGNNITNNRIFPLGTALGVVQDTVFSSTTRFASFDFNHHSALVSKQIARERWTGGEVGHEFIEWQSAKAAGVPRNLDANGRQITLVGYTNFQVVGESLIAPISTSEDTSAWRAWSNVAPQASVSAGACGALPCIRMVAGGNSSLLSTPNFSVEEGRWYRLAFDMKTKFDNQKVVLAPRRGGGGNNGYELFTHTTSTVYGNINWKRYVLLVEASLTIQANDPITGDMGARLDFQNVMPGQEITLANVELVPLLPVGSSLRTALLSNATGIESEASCPDENISPTACSQYVSFTSGMPISWPFSLAPYSSEIVYTQDTSLIDSDGDGIADVQDQCPETPQSSAANSLGCPLP